MINLPKEGESQRIGRLAKRALVNQLPDNWIEKELDGDSDYGIDYLIQLKNNDSHVEFSFYLQLKGTKSPKYSESKTFISHPFKTSTLEYYLRQDPLVMVAIVDILSDRKLYECPIYYFWLDDEWFRQNFDKIKNQENISIQIPTTNNLNQDLDIYDFYVSRFREKLAFSELKKGISDQDKSIPETVEFLAKRIIEKPIFLKSIEKQSEAPWIDNPSGEVATELKSCSDFLLNNRVKDAKKILEKLEEKKENFTTHEFAEFFYQKANISSYEGFFDEAENLYKLSYEKNQKERYQLAYLQSKFKLDSMPSEQELKKIINILDESDFTKCVIKAKSLALLKKPFEALNILKQKYPNEITAQMGICTIGELYQELDKIIEENINSNFDSERKKYDFYSLAARRYFHKSSNQIGVFGEILPLDGLANYDVVGMKLSYEFLQKAWNSAKKLGYPSDVIILMDISALIYGYFNKLDELIVFVDNILAERPRNKEIIKPYIRILFNCRNYKKTVDLLEELESLGDLDADECGIKILSYSYLGHYKQCLDFIHKYEDILISSGKDNIPAIFCNGIEIAEAMLKMDLVDKYREIVKKLPEGEAFLAIQKFVMESNNDKSRRYEFTQDLYQTYLKLGKPLVIAEQLLPYLNPHETQSAHQIIELAEQILNVRELRKSRYLDLAQAFFTTGRWKEAEVLAEKNINKGIAISKWKLVMAGALKNQGKVGNAYNIIREAIQEDSAEQLNQKFYIDLCFSLGFIEEVMDILENNLVKFKGQDEEIYIVRRLIEIYANNEVYNDKLKLAILKYGDLINRNNVEHEGDYLQLCMLYNPFEDNEEINNFEERSNRYFESFPNSKILRRGEINVESGVEGFLESFRVLTGITPEQEERWKINKQKMRNRELPIPFFMRGEFLQNTRDVYTTWMLSKHCTEEELEFKIIHSHQMEVEIFLNSIENTNNILIEETSLLILSDLSLLDVFLNLLPNFLILDSVFKRISLTTYNSISPNSQVSGLILKSIQNNIERLQLVCENEINDFHYDGILEGERILFLTDDFYLSVLMSEFDSNVSFANVFNVLEFLFYKNVLSKDLFFEKIVSCFSLGIVGFNIRLDFLGELVNFYLGKPDICNYELTDFKDIFDKLLDERNSFLDKKLFFFNMFSYVDINSLNPRVILSLIGKLLESNPIIDPQNVVNTWFIYCGLKIELRKKSEALKSEVHKDFWFKYKQVIEVLNDTSYSNKFLLQNIFNVTQTLDENICQLAFSNLKASFSTDSEEYQFLETLGSNSQA
ncbi:hypothetical protein A7P54_06990 [Acinetobacter sp. Ac_3412]|uniref:DUF4365 domain-containing protein n=1 Tax=Acinetobacter sp. Ac_3412 TaxID=1848935 RepID=UPI0014907D6E|nr:DUF4365 domain-containing protein [Acinetobacter sp. Ac_3412]NNP76165.1 hypothetical protein [Acinetobacter sp. Ac_3412]